MKVNLVRRTIIDNPVWDHCKQVPEIALQALQTCQELNRYGTSKTKFSCTNLATVPIRLPLWRKIDLQNFWWYKPPPRPHPPMTWIHWRPLLGVIKINLTGPFSQGSINQGLEWCLKKIKVRCWPLYHGSYPRFTVPGD